MMMMMMMMMIGKTDQIIYSCSNIKSYLTTTHLKFSLYLILGFFFLQLSSSVARARENPCSLTQLTAQDTWNAPTRASSVARAEWTWPLTGKKASATMSNSSNARDRDKNHRIGVNARKKKHGKDTQHQRRKKEEQNHFCQHKLVFSRASERQSQFILWHKNYNDRKKDTIFLWT